MVDKLTPRLREVLQLVAAGLRTKDIAIKLGIGEKTVKMHRSRLFSALAVGSIAEVVRIAIEADVQLLDLDRV
jgi:DNA-binding NarL/FixJ family response regulator